MTWPNNSTMRLRRLRVSCRHRGAHPLAEAHNFAVSVVISHGWSSAFTTVETCGCFTLLRSRAEAEAWMEAEGLTGTLLTGGRAAPDRQRLH